MKINEEKLIFFDMSINERRDKLRQSLFKKLCMINTKSQYSKVPL